MQSTASDITRAVLQHMDGDKIILAIPSTDYQIHLMCSGNTATQVGKRIQGVINIKALRMHKASAGGSFIEPIYGHPRVVQGRVLAVDVTANAVLLELAFPAWVTIEPSQTAGSWQTGDMLNFYVESGMTFTPTA